MKNELWFQWTDKLQPVSELKSKLCGGGLVFYSYNVCMRLIAPPPTARPPTGRLLQ